MVKVAIRREGESYEVEMTGHTRYAPYGQDVVCAGLSALFFTLLRSVSYMEEEGECTDAYCSVAPGAAFAAFCIYEEFYEKNSTAVEAIIDGFRMMAEQYPDHVKIFE